MDTQVSQHERVEYTPPAIRWRAWIFAGIAAGLAAWACVEWVDRPVAAWVHRQGPMLSRIGSVLGQEGNAAWWVILLPIAAIVAWRAGWERARVRILDVFIGMVLAGLAMVDVVKWIVGRARPMQFWKTGAWGAYGFHTDYGFTGFPSGHAATFAAVCTGLTLAWPRRWWVWVTLWITLAGCRIATASHYASDVLVGGYLGALGVMLGGQLHAWWRRRGAS